LVVGLIADHATVDGRRVPARANATKNSPKTLRIAAERGEIEATHPLAEGPWLFKRAILEREETKCLVERVHRRRLHPTGPKYQQSNLFESMT
jgi:hypothetical protein